MLSLSLSFPLSLSLSLSLSISLFLSFFPSLYTCTSHTASFYTAYSHTAVFLTWYNLIRHCFSHGIFSCGIFLLALDHTHTLIKAALAADSRSPRSVTSSEIGHVFSSMLIKYRVCQIFAICSQKGNFSSQYGIFHGLSQEIIYWLFSLAFLICRNSSCCCIIGYASQLAFAHVFQINIIAMKLR